MRDLRLRPGTGPDPAATYPGPVPDPAATYPGPVPDPAATYPEPMPDPAITHPEPRPDPTTTHPEPRPDPTTTHPEPRPDPAITSPDPGAELDRRQRRAARRPPRAQTRQVFAELARLAALPPDSYAVDEAVDGAMCLVSTDTGFEVFSASDGVKREARLFNDEEAAYFYRSACWGPRRSATAGRCDPGRPGTAHLNSYGDSCAARKLPQG